MATSIGRGNIKKAVAASRTRATHATIEGNMENNSASTCSYAILCEKAAAPPKQSIFAHNVLIWSRQLDKYAGVPEARQGILRMREASLGVDVRITRICK
eukprot:6189727-Pleurochrysis_carterae.AAC.1